VVAINCYNKPMRYWKNPRKGPGQPGHSWLKQARQPLHYLRTEINNTSRTLNQIADLLDEIQSNIGGLRNSEFNSLVGELLMELKDSHVTQMLEDLQAELKTLSPSQGLRPAKRELIDIAHKYNVVEQRRLRDHAKTIDWATSYPWIDIYDQALGFGGDVYFISPDRRQAGFVLPKTTLQSFTDYLDMDKTYEWKLAKGQKWLLRDEPALVVIECLALRDEKKRDRQIAEKQSRRRVKRHSKRRPRRKPRRY